LPQGLKQTKGVAQMMPFRIGADASCTDGACGQVSRIIVKPVAREVTHLAVDPKHQRGRDPTGQPRAAKQVNLAVLLHMANGPGKSEAPQQVWVDYVPSGAVDIRRELTVWATDGEIGQAQGLLVEPGGHQVTHVLLQAGDLRGRKEVAIPISAVTKIGTMLIHLSLTKHQVKDLPPVAIDHPAG
jgi:sporulation protein YlmC with PRC-barrel domain